MYLRGCFVMLKQLIPVFFYQAGPVILFRHNTFVFIRRLGSFIGHLQKQQISKLLDIITITHTVIAQDVR